MKRSRVAVSASVFFALVAVSSAIVPMLAPANAEAQYVDPVQRRCQQVLADSSRVYLERVMAARLRCENRVVRSLVPPPATDCRFGAGDDKLQRAMENATIKLDRALSTACVGVNLAFLNFPGACPDPSGGTFVVDDLQKCVRAESDVVIDDLLHRYYPTKIDAVRGPESSCLGGTARDAFAMFRYNIRVRHRCLLDQRIDKIDAAVNCRADILAYGPGTGDDNVDRAIRRAYIHLLGGIPAQCANIQIDKLGYQEVCPDSSGGIFTVLDLKTCLFDLNRAQTPPTLAIAFPTEPVCGNGRVEGSEQCDNGNNNSDEAVDACRKDCTNHHCGDKVTDTGEQCDDGNTATGDGCLPTCVKEVCGDGVVNNSGAEQCDDGTTNNSDSTPDACRTDCKNPSCGDGVTDPLAGEKCDDHNVVSNDGCSATCQIESCGDGIKQTSEECDNGTTNNSDSTPDACRTNCKNPKCGDAVLDPGHGEQCEDGNTDDSDGCTSCRICGNGIVSAPEQCDGNSDPCGGGEGCSSSCKCEPACPGFGELTLYSAIGSDCSSNSDCAVGQCDVGLGRCRTTTQLDSGWTGLSHDADINNFTVTHGYLECPGKGPTCGQCNVVGFDPAGGSCRCSNNTRTICDQPFVADAGNCGGAVCDCYFGAPFPLSSAGTPACIVNRFSEDISGTADVDLGAGQITANLRTQVFLGISTTAPCPECGGKCSDDAASICVFDSDCVAGTCLLDPVRGDGVRGGVCRNGRNAGLDCDVAAVNTSFPALPNEPGGAGYSLDCLPDGGKNVSGSGLVIKLVQTTGTTKLDFNVPCGNGSEYCPCRQCSTDNTVSCNSDAECASQPGGCSVEPKFHCSGNADCVGVNAGTCLSIKRCSLATGKSCTTNTDCASASLGSCDPSTCSSNGAGGFPEPNSCDNLDCSDIGGGEGQCTTGPDGKSCDAVVRAGGQGVLSCNTNDDCAEEAVGVPAGNCELVERRKCFLDPLVGTGQASPTAPIGAAVFCVPPTSAASINSVAGLPGPGRTLNQATSRLFCASDPTKRYTPGVGGCLD